MRIALDYDKTYTAHPAFWDAFLVLARHNGHDVRVVTARSPVLDRTEKLVELEEKAHVIYCNGIAKEYHCTYWTGGWYPDIWIDDKPVNILHNSPTPPDGLAKWRMERNEGPSFPLGDGLHPIGVNAAYAGIAVAPGHIIVRNPDSGGLEVCPLDEVFHPHTEERPPDPVSAEMDESAREIARMIGEGGPGHE